MKELSKSIAFNEGIQAFQNNLSPAHNPYLGKIYPYTEDKTKEAKEWLMGWMLAEKQKG